MMRRIIENSRTSIEEPKDFFNLMNYNVMLAFKELIIRPSLANVGIKSPTFFQQTHGVICGPINPPSGLFKYFMVLIDASNK